MSAGTRSLLSGLLMLLVGCTPTPKYQGIDMSTHNRIPLAPVCVGQFTLQFPRNGELQWDVNLDWASVERLPLRLREARDFWAHVEGRRDALAAQHHNVEPSLLSHYERVDDRSALLLQRAEDTNVSAYYLERYLWLGDRGYLFKGLGEGEEIKAKLPAYKQIFSRLQPLTGIDQKGGFCIDGAVVNADIKLAAGISVDLRGYDNATFTISTVEANAVEELLQLPANEAWLFSAAGHLDVAYQEFSQLRSDALIRDMFDSPKEIATLRSGNRTVAGRHGEEAIWMKRFNNGAKQYYFMWTRSDGAPSLHETPSLTLQLSAGDAMNPDARIPPEQDLLALWDTVLDSAKRR